MKMHPAAGRYEKVLGKPPLHRASTELEQACRRRLFVLPPRSPQLNGRVERAQRTHKEEFNEVTPCSWLIPQLNQPLRAWEHTYNPIRPHQTLHYLTPRSSSCSGCINNKSVANLLDVYTRLTKF